jgi:hypothetical protein
LPNGYGQKSVNFHLFSLNCYITVNINNKSKTHCKNFKTLISSSPGIFSHIIPLLARLKLVQQSLKKDCDARCLLFGIGSNFVSVPFIYHYCCHKLQLDVILFKNSGRASNVFELHDFIFSKFWLFLA